MIKETLFPGEHEEKQARTQTRADCINTQRSFGELRGDIRVP